MKNILAIHGSYRRCGITKQAVDLLQSAFERDGHQVETVDLADCHVAFCTNCRACTQEPGQDPGRCPLDDDMPSLIRRIEQADILVLASPVNCGTVTALYKRFMERLVCYTYWPWGDPAPKQRRTATGKEAILITSSAMPGVMARFFTHAMSALKLTARTIGARPKARVYIGMAAGQPGLDLPRRSVKKLARVATKLSGPDQGRS